MLALSTKVNIAVNISGNWIIRAMHGESAVRVGDNVGLSE